MSEFLSGVPKQITAFFLPVLIFCCITLSNLPVQSAMPIDYVVEVSAEIQSPTTIRLTWPTTGITGAITVYKRVFGDKTWGTAIATLTKDDTEYIDKTMDSKVLSEYQVQATKGTTVAYGYITSTVNLPVVESRGSLLLLVDDTMATPLTTELDRLELDLIGDGWKVIRKDVSRTAKPTDIKAIIQAAVTADPTIKSLFLFGHVPVLRSGWFAPDGHAARAWPADVYYGDFTGKWTDTLDNTNSKPDDGTFDNSSMPADVTLQIGRVDLWNLSKITKSETELLRQYLDKDHHFRHGLIATQNKGLVDDNFGGYGEGFAQNAFRNFAPFFGATNTDNVDWKSAPTTPYLWAYGTGAGSYESCNGVAVTADMNTADPGVFTMLFGSYFGEWDSANNLLRAALATPTNGLTCTWAGRPHWAMHPMAMGETIGKSALISQNNNYGNYSPANFGTRQVHIALMGDPSLRMHPVAPPTNLAIVVNGNSAKLTWTASKDTVFGYNIYRASAKKGTYTRVNTAIVTALTYTDASKPANTAAYMVRAVKLQTSSSGSYNNISQGVYVDVTGTQPGSPSVDFNPAAGTYASPLSVVLSISNGANGDQIRYTTNGSAPAISSTLYTTALTLTTNTTVRAQVFRTGVAQGTATSAVYVISANQSSITASPAAGTYASSVNVTLTGGSTGEEIRYTTNNSNPTSSSTLYSGPITITSTTTIRAQLYKAGTSSSTVMSATYTITAPSTLTLTPPAGTYSNYVVVKISGAAKGTIVRYTLDGTAPTSSSPISAGQITIITSKTLRAQAFLNGIANGTEVTGDYVINIGAPSLSPLPGTFTSTTLVTINRGANVGTIRYTLDGTDPTATSTVYTSAISIPTTTTITARVFNGNTISQAVTGTYTINSNIPAHGIDMIISTITGKSVGEGIVSTTGDQIATISVPTKRSANYSIVIKNTGYIADSFYVSSSSGKANWLIKYYTVEGVDITRTITGNWITPVIQPGKSFTIRLDVVPASGLLIGQSSLSLNITGKAISNQTITDMVTAETIVSKIKQ